MSDLRIRGRGLRSRARRRLHGSAKALVNGSAKARAKLRNHRVITRVAEHDDMLTGGDDLRNYFEVGESALHRIKEGLHAADAPAPTRILDLPSGFGRVLRYLRAEWPGADITAMELVPEAAQFCRDAFGARAVVSREPIWTATGAGDGYDLLWCGSLLTHFDEHAWGPTLAFFRDRLADGGVVVFTTHGDLSIDLLAGDPAARRAIGRWVGDYGMGQKAQEMSNLARRSGFAFGQYGDEANAFGLSVSAPRWVREVVGHQDVWTYVRRSGERSMASNPTS